MSAADDEKTLHRLGYAQELLRRMSGFSNYALSLSIICILAGGVTSFGQGLCSVGGAAIGLGWPLVTLFSLAVAATMGQVASAFPTAGGLYHWAAILGGRGWGWATAWFNLAGLVAVLAAIDAGAVDFLAGCLGWKPAAAARLAVVAAVVLSQAALNHGGIRLVTRLIDFSGWWILAASVAVTAAVLLAAPALDWPRLVTFTNYSGLPADDPVWPRTESLAWLFALGFLLPAYTLTGFDASAHAAEETVGAAAEVPRAIVRAVAVSGAFGWVMLAAVVLAVPDLDAVAAAGNDAFPTALNATLRGGLATALFIGIGVAQYLCGLATVTSASRMTYAFARDGGLPASGLFRRVDPVRRSPAYAIWAVSVAALALTALVPYATIAAACAVLLYISYVLPTWLGLLTYGRRWTRMGPWQLGPWYRPLALVAVAGCMGLLVIGMQPPNEIAGWIVLGMTAGLVVGWWGGVRRVFPGPPRQMLEQAGGLG
ncbi:MAG TPA: amino acid permease [Gemmataceae bacterium]|jgi:amino acid transporter